MTCCIVDQPHHCTSWLFLTLNLACMPWTQASCLRKMPPLQLAGSTAHVFVSAANAEWNHQTIDMGSISVAVITATSAMNDLLHRWSTPSLHQLIVFNFKPCMHAMDTSKPPPQDATTATRWRHSTCCFCVWSEWKSVKEKNEIFSGVTWAALLSSLWQVPQVSCCIVDWCCRRTSWLFLILTLACMPWMQACCLHDIPPLQVASGTTQVLFVSGVNAKQSKKRLKTSAEWHRWHGSLAVALPQQQATNDLLHRNRRRHLTGWLFLILTLACMSQMQAHCLHEMPTATFWRHSATCFFVWVNMKNSKNQKLQRWRRSMWVALPQQVSWMTCCDIDWCHHRCIGWLFFRL